MSLTQKKKDKSHKDVQVQDNNFYFMVTGNPPSKILSSSLDPEVIWIISSLWACSWVALVKPNGTNFEAVNVTKKSKIKLMIQKDALTVAIFNRKTIYAVE